MKMKLFLATKHVNNQEVESIISSEEETLGGIQRGVHTSTTKHGRVIVHIFCIYYYYIPIFILQ